MDFFRHSLRISCLPFYTDSFLVDMFITSSFISIAVPFLLLFASFWQKELYTLFFSIFSFLNWLINYVLRSLIIKDPTPQRGCSILKYGMPCMEVQQAFFVMIFFFSYIVYWRRSFTTVLSRVLILANMCLYISLVVSSQIYLGSNTPYQVIIGALVGFLVAQIAQDIVFYLVYPHFPRILSWKIIKRMGYQDNMCMILLKDKIQVNFMNTQMLPVLLRFLDRKTIVNIVNNTNTIKEIKK